MSFGMELRDSILPSAVAAAIRTSGFSSASACSAIWAASWFLKIIPSAPTAITRVSELVLSTPARSRAQASLFAEEDACCWAAKDREERKRQESNMRDDFNVVSSMATDARAPDDG